MDPLTHLLIGTGVAGLTGHPLSLNIPVQVGALIGSIVPDLDIIYQFKGDMKYLKHHRGFSHSLPGIGLASFIVALALQIFFPSAILGQTVLWTFLGALSHILVDIFNSYGARIFLPLNKKMQTLNLLMIFDPIIIAIFALNLIFYRRPFIPALLSFTLLGGYLMFRWQLRRRVENYLGRKFRNRERKRVIVMPSNYSILGWDFLVETSKEFIVGHVSGFSWRTGLRCRLAKEKNNRLIQMAMESKIGELFREFTPYYHLTYHQEGDKYIFVFTDLRYYVKKGFMHSATLIIDEKFKIVSGFFHPYSKKRNIQISC